MSAGTIPGRASAISLRPAETADDVAACWPLMRLLRPHLPSAEVFMERVARQQTEGYRILVALPDGKVTALAGWRIQDNLVHGRHIYVDDLVTRPECRGQGWGAHLLAALGSEATRQGCTKLVLDTALGNADAQRFYRREGFRNTALKFAKDLA